MRITWRYYVVVPSIFFETIFRYVLRIVSHIHFKCDTIIFYKQNKYQQKYQRLGIAPLKAIL